MVPIKVLNKGCLEHSQVINKSSLSKIFGGGRVII